MTTSHDETGCLQAYSTINRFGMDILTREAWLTLLRTDGSLQISPKTVSPSFLDCQPDGWPIRLFQLIGSCVEICQPARPAQFQVLRSISIEATVRFVAGWF